LANNPSPSLLPCGSHMAGRTSTDSSCTKFEQGNSQHSSLDKHGVSTLHSATCWHPGRYSQAFFFFLDFLSGEAEADHFPLVLEEELVLCIVLAPAPLFFELDALAPADSRP
jgi:hypothetical protein